MKIHLINFEGENLIIACLIIILFLDFWTTSLQSINTAQEEVLSGLYILRSKNSPPSKTCLQTSTFQIFRRWWLWVQHCNLPSWKQSYWKRSIRPLLNRLIRKWKQLRNFQQCFRWMLDCILPFWIQETDYWEMSKMAFSGNISLLWNYKNK